MRTSNSVQLMREIARGRIEITRMTSHQGSQVTIYADRLAAILATTALLVVTAIVVAQTFG